MRPAQSRRRPHLAHPHRANDKHLLDALAEDEVQEVGRSLGFRDLVQVADLRAGAVLEGLAACMALLVAVQPAEVEGVLLLWCLRVRGELAAAPHVAVNFLVALRAALGPDELLLLLHQGLLEDGQPRLDVDLGHALGRERVAIALHGIKLEICGGLLGLVRVVDVVLDLVPVGLRVMGPPQEADAHAREECDVAVVGAEHQADVVVVGVVLTVGDGGDPRARLGARLDDNLHICAVFEVAGGCPLRLVRQLVLRLRGCRRRPRRLRRRRRFRLCGDLQQRHVIVRIRQRHLQQCEHQGQLGAARHVESCLRG
mmetsp:Transcript_107839/g.287098  ORF Transcript_107839/g.287098 Transcript_107839/m.287098 type:complete len:313 (+) Transcript_107839:86-1024(+)